MRNHATIELIGYVYGNPEHPMADKYPNWIKFSLSVTKKWKDKIGEEKKEITWFKCNSWSEGLTKMIKNNVTGGMGLLVKGTPKVNAWIDAEGGAKGQIEVHISDINMLTYPSPKEDDIDANGKHKLSPKASIVAVSDGEIEDDEEIPF